MPSLNLPGTARAGRHLAVAALLSVTLTACPGSETSTDESGQTTPAAGACAEAYRDQQVAGRARPTTAAAKAADLVAAPIVGMAENGVCLTTFWELHTPGWEVVTVDLEVRRGKTVYAATMTEADLTVDRRDLYAPLTGCVEARWTYHLTGPGQATGTWTASSVHGRDCGRSRG